MATRPPHIRFFLRNFDDEPYWSVIDTFTGQAYVLSGIALENLDADDADQLVDLLNLRDLIARGILKNP
jgi:hypothetical protein